MFFRSSHCGDYRRRLRVRERDREREKEYGGKTRNEQGTKGRPLKLAPPRDIAALSAEKFPIKRHAPSLGKKKRKKEDNIRSSAPTQRKHRRKPCGRANETRMSCSDKKHVRPVVLSNDKTPNCSHSSTKFLRE